MARRVGRPSKYVEMATPLRRWREEVAQVTIDQMARLLGVTRMQYVVYEKGEDEYPAAFLKKLEAFGLDGKEEERKRKDLAGARLAELRRVVMERLGIEGGEEE
jgi:transcriptional regulator with XRE-family HTH domain